MNDIVWKEFVEKAKAEYNKIGNISCPVFGNDPVYFNKHGFNHLLRKGKKYRPRDEQIKRIHLLPSAVYILRRAQEIRGYRSNTVDDVSADFWTIRGIHDGSRIRVILRRLGNSKLHFFSVMQE